MQPIVPSGFRFVDGANIDAEHPYGDLNRIILDANVKPLRSYATLRGEDLAILYEQAGQLFQIFHLGTRDSYIPRLEFSRIVSASQMSSVADFCEKQWRNVNPTGYNDTYLVGFSDSAYDPDGRCEITPSSSEFHVHLLNLAFGAGNWWKPDSYVTRVKPSRGSALSSSFLDSLYADSLKFKHVAKVGRKTNYFDYSWGSAAVLELIEGSAPSTITGNGIHFEHRISDGTVVTKAWYGSRYYEQSIAGFFDVNCANIKNYAMFHVSVVRMITGGTWESHSFWFIRKINGNATWQQLRTYALDAMTTLGVPFPTIDGSNSALATIDVTVDDIAATGDLKHTDWWN